MLKEYSKRKRKMDRVNKDYEDKMNNNFKRIEPVLCKKIMDYIVQPILLND